MRISFTFFNDDISTNSTDPILELFSFDPNTFRRAGVKIFDYQIFLHTVDIWTRIDDYIIGTVYPIEAYL